MTVLEGMRSDMDPLQHRLATDIIGLWGRVVPMTLGPDADRRVLTDATAASVQRMFDDADAQASVVHVFRTILPHHAENEDRDEASYRAAKEFIGGTADRLAEYLRHGSFVMEGWLFHRLIGHLKDLLRIVLGDAHSARFIERYDAAMNDIAEQVLLNQTPPN
jgi:hypothetical protein